MTPQVGPSVISAIKISSIGCNPKAAAALPEGDLRQIHLATWLGQVTALTYGRNEDESTYIALSGRFQATCQQADNAGVPNPNYGITYESGRCFLPPGTMESIIAQCKKVGLVESPEDKRSKKVDKELVGGKSVNFAFDVYVKKANNASGITYVCTPILEPTEADPMSEMRKAIAATREKLQAQLAAGASTQPAKQLEAPAPAKTKR